MHLVSAWNWTILLNLFREKRVTIIERLNWLDQQSVLLFYNLSQGFPSTIRTLIAALVSPWTNTKTTFLLNRRILLWSFAFIVLQLLWLRLFPPWLFWRRSLIWMPPRFLFTSTFVTFPFTSWPFFSASFIFHLENRYWRQSSSWFITINWFYEFSLNFLRWLCRFRKIY